MNSKNLIISFVTVSIAALVVSSFAVFTVARRYASEFSALETEENISPPETTAVPEQSLSLPTVNYHPDTEPETSEEETSEYEAETSSVPEETTVTITETEEISNTPVDFTLTLSGDRLVILSPAGDSVYERIINISELHEKDKEALLTGILFPDRESAMSAVYDLIS